MIPVSITDPPPLVSVLFLSFFPSLWSLLTKSAPCSACIIASTMNPPFGGQIDSPHIFFAICFNNSHRICQVSLSVFFFLKNIELTTTATTPTKVTTKNSPLPGAQNNPLLDAPPSPDNNESEW